MIQIVKGDLLLSDANVLVHQVNCKGVMGAGLASQIRNRYPEVFKAYTLLCHEYMYSQYLLPGKTQLVEVEESRRYVANLFAQSGYGRGQCHTDYDAFRTCLQRLAKECEHLPQPVHIGLPYGIGCGLAGGDWNLVYPIIRSELADWDVSIYLR